MRVRSRVLAAAAMFGTVLACGGGTGPLNFLDLSWQNPGDTWEDAKSSWEQILSSSEQAAKSGDIVGSGGVGCLRCGQNYKCTTSSPDSQKTETGIVSTTTSGGLCIVNDQVFRKDGTLYDPQKQKVLGTWSCQGGAFVANYDVTVDVKGQSTTTIKVTTRCEPTTETPKPKPTSTGTTTVPPPPPTNPPPPPPIVVDAGQRGTVADYGRCTVTGDCASQGATCLLKGCVPACSQTSPCPAPPPGGNLTPQCTGGRCLMTCSAQGSTCPTGMACVSGACGYN